MALDRSFVELYFSTHYKRGAILRFQMKCDDPKRQFRDKFAVVLNNNLSEPETLLVLTTSQTQKFSSPFLDGDVLRIDQGKYACFPAPTVVSLREIRIEQTELLKDKAGKGLLTFEGEMTEVDMSEIDQKLKSSKLIEGNILKRIL
jgi:hypothetical protein